ncbi:phospholipase A and acyltransferase 2-like isoform X3 [Malaclemys terrapin pileata]|uniref:phospholipase A and acyltransferase 2-like isoform X3 n=1 Tax=Malaclemys terrapin pileata TaxID=2991368 RepID=UPI0023A8371E|nr:phospholipase A and acyltransferase 2-like isoform X3 [Malaclemys terrapin pileata]
MPLKGVEPKPGDLIEISRFGYRHWALYVGYGYVIHLAPPSEFTKTGFSSLMSVVADKAVVRKEPLWAVVKGDDYRVNNKHDGKLPRRSVDQIIQEAESLVQDAMVAGAVGIVGVGALVAVATFIGALLSDNKQEDE